jgi:two-component system, LytTR family, response regulator
VDGQVTARLRIVVADDERPARSFLVTLLRSFQDVVVVGAASSGKAAVAMIEHERPDLALLDLQMPELDGIGVVRMLKKKAMPLIAFVTAFDEYAVRAFEVNAVDYLLKPVDKKRLRATLDRALDRIEHGEVAERQGARLGAAIDEYQSSVKAPYLQRIPVRHREEVMILPVSQIASVVAEGEILNITTVRNERHSLTYRLKDLEMRLDPERFVRLGRGTLANVDSIARVNVMPGGTHLVILGNGQRLPLSRLQSRALRDRFLKL